MIILFRSLKNKLLLLLTNIIVASCSLIDTNNTYPILPLIHETSYETNRFLKQENSFLLDAVYRNYFAAFSNPHYLKRILFLLRLKVAGI